MPEFIRYEDGRFFINCPNCDLEYEIVKRGDKLKLLAEYKKEVKDKKEDETPEGQPKEEIKPENTPKGKSEKGKSVIDRFTEWLDKD